MQKIPRQYYSPSYAVVFKTTLHEIETFRDVSIDGGLKIDKKPKQTMPCLVRYKAANHRRLALSNNYRIEIFRKFSRTGMH